MTIRFAAVEPHPTLAFTIGKRFGNAVERNRARRRLRAAFTELAREVDLVPGAYVISGSRAVLTCEFDSLIRSIARCCEQLSPSGQLSPPKSVPAQP